VTRDEITEKINSCAAANHQRLIEFQQIKDLTVEITDDSDFRRDGLDVGFLHEQFRETYWPEQAEGTLGHYFSDRHSLHSSRLTARSITAIVTLSLYLVLYLSVVYNPFALAAHFSVDSYLGCQRRLQEMSRLLVSLWYVPE
jgi:hypothetical protein